MNVSIKDFNVQMELKNKGVELEVRDPQDNHLGDLVITKSKLIWCKGKTHRKNGVKVSWTEFIRWMNSD